MTNKFSSKFEVNFKSSQRLQFFDNFFFIYVDC